MTVEAVVVQAFKEQPNCPWCARPLLGDHTFDEIERCAEAIWKRFQPEVLRPFFAGHD